MWWQVGYSAHTPQRKAEFAPPSPPANAGRADGVPRLTNQMRRKPAMRHSSRLPRPAAGGSWAKVEAGGGGGRVGIHTKRVAHTRLCIRKTRPSMAPARVLLVKAGAGAGRQFERSDRPVQQREPRQGHFWRCTHKVVHAQGVAHTTRFVSTAGVLFLKGGCGRWPPR